MMLNVVFGGKGVGLDEYDHLCHSGGVHLRLDDRTRRRNIWARIEGREMKAPPLCIIIHPLLILAFSALAVGAG